MKRERLEELRDETAQYRAVADDRCMSTQYEDDILALIDAELARQSVTDEAVQRAIEWAEHIKKYHQDKWKHAEPEWRAEPGAQEQEDELMAAFDLAIQALCQMRSAPCEICGNFKRVDCKADNLEFTAVRCPNCGRRLVK